MDYRVDDRTLITHTGAFPDRARDGRRRPIDWDRQVEATITGDWGSQTTKALHDAAIGAASGAVFGGGVPGALVGAAIPTAMTIGNNVWYATRSKEDKASWQAGDAAEQAGLIADQVEQLPTGDKDYLSRLAEMIRKYAAQYKDYIDVVVQKNQKKMQGIDTKGNAFYRSMQAGQWQQAQQAQNTQNGQQAQSAPQAQSGQPPDQTQPAPATGAPPSPQVSPPTVPRQPGASVFRSKFRRVESTLAPARAKFTRLAAGPDDFAVNPPPASVPITTNQTQISLTASSTRTDVVNFIKQERSEGRLTPAQAQTLSAILKEEMPYVQGQKAPLATRRLLQRIGQQVAIYHNQNGVGAVGDVSGSAPAASSQAPGAATGDAAPSSTTSPSQPAAPNAAQGATNPLSSTAPTPANTPATSAGNSGDGGGAAAVPSAGSGSVPGDGVMPSGTGASSSSAGAPTGTPAGASALPVTTPLSTATGNPRGPAPNLSGFPENGVLKPGMTVEEARTLIEQLSKNGKITPEVYEEARSVLLLDVKDASSTLAQANLGKFATYMEKAIAPDVARTVFTPASGDVVQTVLGNYSGSARGRLTVLLREINPGAVDAQGNINPAKVSLENLQNVVTNLRNEGMSPANLRVVSTAVGGIDAQTGRVSATALDAILGQYPPDAQAALRSRLVRIMRPDGAANSATSYHELPTPDEVRTVLDEAAHNGIRPSNAKFVSQALGKIAEEGASGNAMTFDSLQKVIRFVPGQAKQELAQWFSANSVKLPDGTVQGPSVAEFWEEALRQVGKGGVTPAQLGGLKGVLQELVSVKNLAKGGTGIAAGILLDKATGGAEYALYHGAKGIIPAYASELQQMITLVNGFAENRPEVIFAGNQFWTLIQRAVDAATASQKQTNDVMGQGNRLTQQFGF